MDEVNGLHIATEPKDIHKIYLRGPISCMKPIAIKARAYGSGDFAVAGLPRSSVGLRGTYHYSGVPDYVARSVLIPKEKLFVRVYCWGGDSLYERTIVGKLRDLGYKGIYEKGHSHLPKALRLRIDRTKSGNIRMPFLDLPTYMTLVDEINGVIVLLTHNYLQTTTGSITAFGERRQDGRLCVCCNKKASSDYSHIVALHNRDKRVLIQSRIHNKCINNRFHKKIEVMGREFYVFKDNRGVKAGELDAVIRRQALEPAIT